MNNYLSPTGWNIAYAVLSIVIGWVLSRAVGRLLLFLLDRTSVDEKIAQAFGQDDSQKMNQTLVRWARYALVAASLVVGWQFLIQIGQVQDAVASIKGWIAYLSGLPILLFIYDVLLVIAATYLLIKVIRWIVPIFERTASVIEKERGKSLRGWKIQKLELFSADRLTDFILLVNRYLRYAVNLILIFVYLAGVFSIFPQTRGVVNDLLSNLLSTLLHGWQGFVDYLPNLLTLVIIVVGTRYLLKFIHFIFKEIGKENITFANFLPEWAEPTYQLVRFLVLAFALVISFPYLPGSASPAFQGISIFAGFLFSLGSSSVIANIIAGIVLTYTGAFKLGDRVKIADTIGDVIEKSLLITRIRTIKNVDITIPNGMVLSSHIINFSSAAKEHGLILHSTVTLGYDIPWKLVHETLINAALSTEYILEDPMPFVFQTSLDDSYVSYEINAYTQTPLKMASIYSELHQNIQDKCNQAGIEILSPAYAAIRDGNQTTIPEDYLPKDYKAPTFRFPPFQK